MIVRVGTSGFSYPEWKGPFYPADISSAEMLSFYAHRMGTVEINSSFYRMPRRTVLESWLRQVPDNFRICLKASRRITHFSRLKPPWDALDYFLDTLSTLGDHLGAILFQLPPDMPADVDRLESFIEHLPDHVPTAFELRHAGWHELRTYTLLEKHLCTMAIADDRMPVESDAVATGPFGYLRLRRNHYSDDELRQWATYLASAAWERAFVFFRHEVSGTGPRLAERFSSIVSEVSP